METFLNSLDSYSMKGIYHKIGTQLVKPKHAIQGTSAEDMLYMCYILLYILYSEK